MGAWSSIAELRADYARIRSPEVQRQHAAWLGHRPPVVQRIAEEYPFDVFYEVRDPCESCTPLGSGSVVSIYSYTESGKVRVRCLLATRERPDSGGACVLLSPHHLHALTLEEVERRYYEAEGS